MTHTLRGVTGRLPAQLHLHFEVACGIPFDATLTPAAQGAGVMHYPARLQRRLPGEPAGRDTEPVAGVANHGRRAPFLLHVGHRNPPGQREYARKW
jgi:hypothetical protein